jgi:DNA polymerase
MSDKIYMDFETYSEANLKNVGASRYARDPSTEVICLSYAFNEEEPVLWIPGDNPPDDLLDEIHHRNEWGYYAWNSGFEINIWNHVCHRMFDWPIIPLEYWYDVQAVALNFALPADLDQCGNVLQLDTLKDKRGKYLINKLSKPQKKTKKDPYTRWTPETHPDLFEEMYEYCKQDVRVEREILKFFPWELPDQELALWRLTVQKNERGIPIDRDLVNCIVEITDEYIEDVSQGVNFLTDGAIETINQRDKILDWCELNGYELPDLTAGTVEKAIKDPVIEEFPKVKALLEIRALAGKTSIKKFSKIQEALCDDDKVRDCLKYHKATTGREGGRLLQPQNLPRTTVDDVEGTIKLFKQLTYEEITMELEDIMHAAASMIRPSICATPGHRFVCSDYSSIENRVVCWLAGQWDILDKIDSGLDMYKDMASDLYEMPYDDIDKESKERRHGKLTILGCGYGMGWKTFKHDCEVKQGFKISDEESKRTINVFRDKYDKVVKLWYGLKDAAVEATINQGTITHYRNIQFMHVHNWLFMILPNGKSLAYYRARVENEMTLWGASYKLVHDGFIPGTKKWGKVMITPGRLAENASQAVSREILMEAWIDVEKKGYPVFLTVHDELVCELKKDIGSLYELNTIMCNRADCYEGLPLKAAGFEAERYRK